MRKIDNEMNECPFCGSENISRVLTVGMKWMIGCNTCGCRTKEFDSDLEAITAWNRRATNQEDTARHISEIMADTMARVYSDDDCDENHMSMPLPIEDTPF